MAYIIGNNLVAANASSGAVDTANILAGSTTKQYFAGPDSNAIVRANSAVPKTVWFGKVMGRYQTGLLTIYPTIILRVEVNRSIIVATSAPLQPLTSITTPQQWELEMWITCNSTGDKGSVTMNGRAGMSLVIGGAITLQPMPGGIIPNVDTTQDAKFEISVQWGGTNATNANNQITLEQFVWEEKRKP